MCKAWRVSLPGAGGAGVRCPPSLSAFSLNTEALEALGKEQVTGRKTRSPCPAHRWEWVTACFGLLHEWELTFSWVRSARRCGLLLKAVNIPLFPILLKEWNVDMFPKGLRGLLDSFSCISQGASNSTCPNLNLWFPRCQTGPVLFIYLGEWYNQPHILYRYTSFSRTLSIQSTINSRSSYLLNDFN